MAYINGSLRAKMPDKIYPNPTNFSGVRGVFEHSNTITGGFFIPLIIMAVFVSAFLILLSRKEYKTSACYALSCLITFALSALLLMTDLLDDMYVIISLVMFLLGIVWAAFDN